MPDDERLGSPIILCRLCGQGIQKTADRVITRLWAAHVKCLEHHAVAQLAVTPISVAPLTDDERSRLFRRCWDHEVAGCAVCSKTYRVNQMGADLFSRQYYLCPLCRVDLTWSIRQHIAACTLTRLDDPHWQADAAEALARARETRKASQQSRDASELTRLESEVLRARARDAVEEARQTQEDSRRVKREPLPGK